MNLNSLLKLKYPDVDFLHEIILQDDGQGPYIKEWNLTDPIPTQEDLDAWAIEFDLQYRQQQAVAKRVYPSVGEQFDMLYKDQMAGTTVWRDTITDIKAKNPKPTK